MIPANMLALKMFQLLTIECSAILIGELWTMLLNDIYATIVFITGRCVQSAKF